MAVVVRGAEAAVDLGRREDEPAPTSERDDLVHRDDVGHRRRTVSRAASTIGRCSPPAHPTTCSCARPRRTRPRGWRGRPRRPAAWCIASAASTWMASPAGAVLAFPRLSRERLDALLPRFLDAPPSRRRRRRRAGRSCPRARPSSTPRCSRPGSARAGRRTGWPSRSSAARADARTRWRSRSRSLERVGADRPARGTAPESRAVRSRLAERAAAPRLAPRRVARRTSPSGTRLVNVTTGRLGVAGIYDMGVAAAERRRGIGSALTAAALELGRAAGLRGRDAERDAGRRAALPRSSASGPSASRRRGGADALAARADREQPLAMVDDLVALAPRLEEVDPRSVELLLPLVVERLVGALRRPVRAREELPVLLAVLRAQDRVVLRELELERVAEEPADVLLVAPRERAADTFREASAGTAASSRTSARARPRASSRRARAGRPAS